MPGLFTIENARRAVRDPSLFVKGIKRVARRPIYWHHNRRFRARHGSGIDVMARDWDNLILLDACRYDYFAEQNTIAGGLSAVHSKGGNSMEFIEENFLDRELHDTVYVTANPHVGKLSEDIFYTVNPLLDRWEENPGTVPPSEVVDAAIEANETHGNKRLIVHFMQPHIPYLGPTAEACYERVDIRGYHPFTNFEEREVEQTTETNWVGAVERGLVSWEESQQAYSETLDIVLEAVGRLQTKLDGKSVVSADHGELLGEQVVPFGKRWIGHPHGLKTEELYTVPWLEIPAEERRDTVSEQPIGFNRIADETVHDRLRALGYESRVPEPDGSGL